MRRQNFHPPRTGLRLPRRSVGKAGVLIWIVACLLAVAQAQAAGRGSRPRDEAQEAAQVVMVRSTEVWTDTGIDLQQGRPLRIDAEGVVRVVGLRMWDWVGDAQWDRRVGPQGTYLYRWPYRRRRTSRPFPLPTMEDGPFPAFGLIGKIGEEGRPWYVGAHMDGTATATGRLWLGINDDDVSDNRGAFMARITPAPLPPPPAPEPPAVEPGARSGRPLPGARVLLLYVDGLRADVLREMAEAELLPHFKRTFLDGGLAVPHAFTVFPSNTLIANGSLFTGLFSDRTGIKSQNQFERSTLKPRGQLSQWLPDGFIPPPPLGHLRWPGLFARVAIGDEGGGGIIPKPATRVFNLLDKYAPEHTHAFLAKRGVPTLGTRLGEAYKFTTLPIAPLNPPPQWLHRAINTLGPLDLARRLPTRLDAVNAQYAIEELIGDPASRVITVWFPMADKTCHHSRRGQFGLARRDLALDDHYLGKIMDRLREVGWDRSTYLILVSDHGHLGGERTINRACNLPRDWAHRQLGCNVHVVGQEWTHPGIDATQFLFFDHQGAGQAKLFLPRGSYLSGAWQRNRLVDLTHYELRPGRPPIDLLQSLTRFRPPGWEGDGPGPVDLILVKLDARRVLVYRDEDHQALIHRVEDDGGPERYRYQPVRRLVQSPDGELHDEPPLPGRDPLGYLADPAFRGATGDLRWIDEAHTAREWLLATSQTRYPDAVVTMAKFFAWKPPVSDLVEFRDPDLLVTASEGWSFRSDDGEGTDHGYPLAGSMRITLFLAGPNIPHGTMRAPQRIVDVLPTILEMVGWPYDASALDGEAIRGIYEEQSTVHGP